MVSFKIQSAQKKAAFKAKSSLACNIYAFEAFQPFHVGVHWKIGNQKRPCVGMQRKP